MFNNNKAANVAFASLGQTEAQKKKKERNRRRRRKKEKETRKGESDTSDKSGKVHGHLNRPLSQDTREGHEQRCNRVRKLRCYHQRSIHLTVINKTIVYIFAPCACKSR